MKKLEVNLDHLSYNLSAVRSLTQKECKICATVKADAYGHGLVPVTIQLVKSGVDFLGLTETKDARIIRELGISTPILLYLPLSKGLEEIFSLDLIPFVSSLSYLKSLEKLAKKNQKKLKVHIKMDTGMGRFGSSFVDTEALIDYTTRSSYLEFHGVCSHFSDSSEDSHQQTTLAQLDRFEALKSKIEKERKLPPFIHIANSEGIINFSQSHYNLVRPGLALYGYSTSPNCPHLLPVMSLYSEVIFVKRVPSGTSVSYNSIYKTKKEVQLCAIPIGYSDGLDIYFSKRRAKVYLNKKFYPIIGKVCMNTSLIEVPLTDSVKVGDPVELVGENQSLIQFSSYYPSGSIYDAMCRLGCGQSKTYK